MNRFSIVLSVVVVVVVFGRLFFDFCESTFTSLKG
jgi:hypothetical protein